MKMAVSTCIQEIPELNPKEFEVVFKKMTNGISTIYCNCPKYDGLVVVKCTEAIRENDLNMLTSSAKLHQSNSASGIFSEFCGEVCWDTFNSGSIYGVVHKSSRMENLGHMIDFMRNKKEKISWALRFRLILDIGRGIKLMHDKGIERNVLATDVIIDKNIRAKLCFAECHQKLPDYAQMFRLLIQKIALGWERKDNNQTIKAIENLQGWNFIGTLSCEDKRIAEFVKTVYDNCISPDANLLEQISMLQRFFDAEISCLAEENAKELFSLMNKMPEFQKQHQYERVLSDVSIKEKISNNDDGSSSSREKSINQRFSENKDNSALNAVGGMSWNASNRESYKNAFLPSEHQDNIILSANRSKTVHPTNDLQNVIGLQTDQRPEQTVHPINDLQNVTDLQTDQNQRPEETVHPINDLQNVQLTAERKLLIISAVGVAIVAVLAVSWMLNETEPIELQQRTRFILDRNSVPSLTGDLSDIYPWIRETDFYAGNQSHGQDVAVHDLFKKENGTFRSVMVLGSAGSGKTTLLQRHAKMVLEKRIKTLLHIEVVIYIPFYDFDATEEVSFEHMMAIMYYPDSDRKTEIFNWMKNNQKKILFIFDGYDQATFTFKAMNCRNIILEAKVLVDRILCNLLKGQLFSESLILMSSREHAAIEMPSEMRPQRTVLLSGFKSKDLERMLQGTNVRGSKMWQRVNEHYPQLPDLCRTPVFFVFVKYMLNDENQDQMVYSYTGVMKYSMKTFIQSEHNRNGEELLKELIKLEKLAYRGTFAERIQIKFTDKDLFDCGLDRTSVYDLQFRVKNGPHYHILNGTTDYIFIHQTVQEYLAALHVVRTIPTREFKSKIVNKMLENPKLSTVRKFMTGLFTNDKLVTDMGLVASEKSDLWSKSLQLSFEDWNKSEKFPVTTQEDLLKLVDLLSLACEMDQAHGVRITQSVRRIDIRTVSVSNAHAHALACMSRLAGGLDHLTLIVADIRPLIISSLFHAKNKIKHVDLSFNLQLALDGNCELSKVFLVQNLKSVNLRQSELTAEPIKCIATALCRRVDEIEVLDLSGNPIGNYGILPIFNCLHKITGHLHLEKARMDLNGGRQDLVVDFQMLQYKLNKLCFTSSEKLKVHIGFDLTKQPNCEDY